MLVAYDGSGFHGFAANKGVKTVAGTLSAAAARYLRVEALPLTCAGRTDSGVHAWGQVVHFDVPEALAGEKGEDLDLPGLQRSLNRSLAPAIVVREVDLPGADFDARHSARWRRYRYTVLNRPVPDPFSASTAWHVERPLDLRAMELACDPLIGEHDFSSFCRKAPDGATLVRRVIEAGWDDLGDGYLRFEIRASSFCHQMVRSVVGTLVEIGAGKRKAGHMSGIIRAQDRSRAASPAPPHGLCLWEVGYSEEGHTGSDGEDWRP
jgi:tRNA pseudouridine38-40 synthase